MTNLIDILDAAILLATLSGGALFLATVAFRSFRRFA